MEHLKPIGFPLETNGKLMVLRVPILRHFRVYSFNYCRSHILVKSKPIEITRCKNKKKEEKKKKKNRPIDWMYGEVCIHMYNLEV